MSRSVPGNSPRMPRGRRGVTTVVAALLAVALCAAAAVEAISLATGGHGIPIAAADAAHFGRHTRVSNGVVLVTAAVLIGLGLILLIAAFVPARRRLVELDEPDRSIAAGVTARSFHRTLTSAAESVDGVKSARVKGRRRLRVRAQTPLRHTTGLADRIEARVRDRLDQLSPAHSRTVRVTVQRQKDA